jgi:hypothetical protein
MVTRIEGRGSYYAQLNPERIREDEFCNTLITDMNKIISADFSASDFSFLVHYHAELGKKKIY